MISQMPLSSSMTITSKPSGIFLIPPPVVPKHQDEYLSAAVFTTLANA
jgi:hypothetical protein